MTLFFNKEINLIVATQKICKDCGRTDFIAFTEIKKRKENEYFYRVLSLRQENKVSKKRIYLGKNLSKKELEKKEIKADKELFKIKRRRKGEFHLIKNKLLKILKKAEIKKAEIFGSYACGEQKKDSDIDILIEPNKKIYRFRFFDFQKKLSDKLGKKVDLITYKSLNHLIKERVLNQEVRII